MLQEPLLYCLYARLSAGWSVEDAFTKPIRQINMNRYYTSIEQSKHLLSLGMNPESADMCWCLAVKGIPQLVANQGYNKYGDFEIPCWSVGGLLEVMPNVTSEDNEVTSAFIAKTPNGKYYFAFATSHKEVLSSNICDTAIDACYDMIVWLLENGYINKEK